MRHSPDPVSKSSYETSFGVLMICRCRKWAKVNNSLALYQLSYEGPLSFDGDRTHDLQIAVCSEHQSRVS